jgi:hypothetical protein
MFACFGDGPRASEGITSVGKPKLPPEFRKIGVVLPKEPSRNYRLYIYIMAFFGRLWAPLNLGVFLSSLEQPRGATAAVEATLMAPGPMPVLPTIGGARFWFLDCIGRFDHRQERATLSVASVRMGTIV